MNSSSRERVTGQSIDGRYFARFPPSMPSAAENDNPILDNQVLRMLMNFGGVTREEAIKWCQTEATFVRNLRYKQSRRGKLEMSLYSALAKVVYVLTLPLSFGIWFTVDGWSFIKRFCSNGNNLFIVALIGASLAWQTGIADKMMNVADALDAEYFRSLEDEMAEIWSNFNELSPKNESSVVSHLVKNRLYESLQPGEEGIDYSGVDMDTKLHDLIGFFGDFPIAPVGEVDIPSFLLKEASRFGDEIKGTPLEAVIKVSKDGFWFTGEEVMLDQSAEWAVERYASNILNAYSKIMRWVWDKRPNWQLVIGSLKAAITEELDTLVEELGPGCDEILKSAHHHLLRSSIGTIPLLAKLSGDIILAKFLSFPPPQPKLFSNQLVQETKRELMQAAVLLLVPPVSKNTWEDITYIRPDAEFQKIDFPTITPTLRFNLTQIATDIDLPATCHFPGHIYLRIRLHRTLHSAFILYHHPPLDANITISLLYLDSPVDNATIIGTTTLTTPPGHVGITPLSAHFRIAMSQAAVRSKKFALQLTNHLSEPCLVNLDLN